MKKLFLSILTVFILIISIFLYINRDKFAYVRSVNIFQLNAFDNIKSKIKNAGMDDFQHQIGLINEVITL